MLQDIAESPEFAPGMVEDAFEDHAQATLVESGDQLRQGRVISQPAIDLEIIGSVVPMRGRSDSSWLG